MSRKKQETLPALHIPQPLQIKIYQEEPTGQPSKRISRLVAVGAVLLFLFSLSFVFLLRRTVTFENSTPPLIFYMDYPRVASLRDPLRVTIVLRNAGPDPLNGVLNLSVQPALALSLTEDGLTSRKIENLAPGASLTQTFEFALLEAPPGGSLNLVVRLTDEQGRSVTSDAAQATVRVLGIPRLQSALAWIFGSSGLLTTLTGLFWEYLKKALAR
jgi:hypothetical protein